MREREMYVTDSDYNREILCKWECLCVCERERERECVKERERGRGRE